MKSQTSIRLRGMAKFERARRVTVTSRSPLVAPDIPGTVFTNQPLADRSPPCIIPRYNDTSHGTVDVHHFPLTEQHRDSANLVACLWLLQIRSAAVSLPFHFYHFSRLPGSLGNIQDRTIPLLSIPTLEPISPHIQTVDVMILDSDDGIIDFGTKILKALRTMRNLKDL